MTVSARVGDVRLLFDPFARVSRGAGILVAIVVMIAGVAIARMGVRFDGFLDLHVTGREVPLRVAVADQVVAIPLGVCIGWAVARLFRARADLFDVLSAVAVARIPPLLGAPLVALLSPPPDRLVAEALAGSPVILLIAVIALPIVAWHITLLVFGMRHATALQGGRLAGLVVAFILSAEIASKLVLRIL